MGRALVADGSGALRLAERPALAPRDGELLVTPLAIGVCGTDLEIIDGLIDAAFVRYPLVIGHEWVGRVAVSTTTRFAPGDRVVVEGIVPCWQCASCVAGATHLCTSVYDEVGFTRDGAGSDEIVVPARLAHRLADGVALEDAVLVEPAAVVYHGLSRTVDAVGLRCLVVGDGTIALLALLQLRLFSPVEVVLAGRRPEQADLARRAGADAVVNEIPADGFDLVIEAAGTNDAVVGALGAARRGGRVLILGLTPHGSVAPVPADDLVNKDLLIRASFGYSAAAFGHVVTLLDAGRLRPGALVTHRFALADYAAAVALLRSPRPGEARGKILLYPGGLAEPAS